jgi:hypothetical protein
MTIGRALAIVAVVCSIATPARAITEEEERAKAHFLAGQSYYDQASYTDALREFNEAYRISKKPALLYNIARCYEALGQLGDAVTMLEHYLQEEPTTSDRPAIETRIVNLKERQAAAARVKPKLEPPDASRPPRPAPSVAPAPVAPPPVASVAPRKRVWTWVVGGAGVGLLAAALGTGIASQLTFNDLNRDCGSGACPAGVANAQSRIDRGKQLSVATDVLWPLGAAAVVTGIVLFVVEGRHAPSRHAQLTPFVTPSSGGLSVARDF